MRWRGGRASGGTEDRRGLGGGAMAGGGIGAVVIGLLGYYFLGIPPQTTQAVLGQFGGLGEQHGTVGTPKDDAGMFVDVVGTNISDVWSKLRSDYQPPKIVIYEQGTNTGCGMGQAAMGPFYCPNDSTVYLDLSFWQEMETRLGASGADFAKAYVIAHEIGHHVQTLTGASQKVQQAQQAARSEGEANQYSVALELQADCYAGVWAKNAGAVSGGQVTAEPGDLEEGLKTAKAIGDDTLTKGRVSPEGFTHGTSAQRMEWLRRGYESGNPDACNTFNGL